MNGFQSVFAILKQHKPFVFADITIVFMPLICFVSRCQCPYHHPEYVFSVFTVKMPGMYLSHFCLAPFCRVFYREDVVQVFSAFVTMREPYETFSERVNFSFFK